MESLEGKHFSITDPVNVNTVVYRLDETEKEFAKNSPKFTIQRLDYTSEYVGEKTKKTFYIDDPSPEGNSLIILSFGKEKVVVNIGCQLVSRLYITKKNSSIKKLNIHKI